MTQTEERGGESRTPMLREYATVEFIRGPKFCITCAISVFEIFTLVAFSKCTLFLRKELFSAILFVIYVVNIIQIPNNHTI